MDDRHSTSLRLSFLDLLTCATTRALCRVREVDEHVGPARRHLSARERALVEHSEHAVYRRPREQSEDGQAAGYRYMAAPPLGLFHRKLARLCGDRDALPLELCEQGRRRQLRVDRRVGGARTRAHVGDEDRVPMSQAKGPGNGHGRSSERDSREGSVGLREERSDPSTRAAHDDRFRSADQLVEVRHRNQLVAPGGRHDHIEARRGTRVRELRGTERPGGYQNIVAEDYGRDRMICACVRPFFCCVHGFG
jgi:hypothetical protein